MNNLISPFPVLQSGVLNLEKKYTFFYNDDFQQLHEIIYDYEEQMLKSKTWSADKFNLKIKVDLEISNVKNLFFGSTAVADEDAEIGVAIRWQHVGIHSRELTVFNCVLTKESDSVKVTSEKVFPHHYLKQQLKWEIVLFLKSSPLENSVYAQTPGSLLGVLDEGILYTGGGNGTFNTVWRAAGKQAPLWEIDIAFNSVDEPFTQDWLMLYLNSDHCARDLVYVDQDKFSPMLFEIFSDVCFVLLKKAVATGFELNDNVTTIETVGDCINVMIKRLFPEWGVGDLAVDDYTLMKNIRQHLLSSNIKVANLQQRENEND